MTLHANGKREVTYWIAEKRDTPNGRTDNNGLSSLQGRVSRTNKRLFKGGKAMPRVTYNIPIAEKEEISRLRKEYGERIGKSDIGRIIGTKNHTVITEWITSKRLTVFRPSKRDVYATEEVVRKLWEDRV